MWGITSVLWGDNISTVEGYLQYCGDNSSTCGVITSVLWGHTFSTVEVVQYSGGITSVQWGDSFIAVEGIQYIGGIISVHVGDDISTVGDNISTVEGIQYSGRRILFRHVWSLIMMKRYRHFFVLRYEIFIRKFFENLIRFHAFSKSWTSVL